MFSTSTILRNYKSINIVFEAKTWSEFYVLIQISNFLLGLLILWLILKFIEEQNLSKWRAISSSLFWRLNPTLISIGALATNDTLLLLEGIVITLLFVRYIKKEEVEVEILMFIMLFLLGITKGNGLVFIDVFMQIIGLTTLRSKKIKWLQLTRQSTLLMVVILRIGYFGNYFEKRAKYNNAFMTNIDPPYEKAQWFKEGEMEIRKGVNTYFEAFLTFPFRSLLATPFKDNSFSNYQPHRQNLWTQMIGQFSNFEFERYPSKWNSVNNDQFNFVRINYILHIL